MLEYISNSIATAPAVLNTNHYSSPLCLPSFFFQDILYVVLTDFTSDSKN